MSFIRRLSKSRRACLIGILLLALALRLIWLDDEGCIPAVSFFIPWMRLAAQGGIARVFEVAESSYPPLTVYILQTLGWFGAVGTMDAAPTLIESLALRVTTAFFDLVTIALLYHIGRRVAGHWIAAGAALLYALCPADIYLSGWWIQIEAWFVLPALLGAWWLSRERVALAWAALGVAVSLKPQAAIIFPVFLVGTWRWWGFRRALMGGLVLLLVILLVFVPILVSGQGRAIVSKMFEPGYDFPWVSLRSYNMWFAVTERAREIGSDFHRDQNALAGYLSFHDVGWSLMALAYGLVLVRLFARSGPREIFVTCILAWFSFFLLPTRIHSRYVFPTQAFMLVAGFHRRRWWALYAVSAVTLFANLAVRACEISPSTCVLSLSLPTTMEIFFAWVNMAVGGLAIAFYLQPLWWPRDRQARLEGPLHVARGGWEKALLIGGGVLLLIIVCGVLWRGWTVGAELSVLEAPLQISLVDALERGAGEVVVVNWPHVIAAGDDAYLGGIVPVVPPALFFSVPEDTYPQATWVQYPPWQRDDLKIDYHGAYVTQPELMEQVRESHRVLGFSPALDEMVALAEREDPALVGRCLAQFDDLVCLSEARAVVQDGVLQVELIWQIHGALSPSTTVFVHVVDEEGNLVVQADGDPVNGLLPLSAWRASDAALSETRLVSVSERAVDRVWMGLYNRTTGNRLPVQCGPAQTCVNGAVQIAGP